MSTRVPTVAATTTELAETEAWLYAQLTGSAALMAAAVGGVWSYVAPVGTPYPLVQFGWHADRDVAALEGSTIWVESVYQVRAYTQSGGEAGLNATAAAIHYALQGQVGMSPSGQARIFSCLRDTGLAMGEVTAGRQYRSAGALYRIRTQLVGT